MKSNYTAELLINFSILLSVYLFHIHYHLVTVRLRPDFYENAAF